MKILTDKVYYNGKEFIVNNWPEEPKSNVAPLNDKYQIILRRSLEEGYVVKDEMSLLYLLPNPINTGTFYTLPEPREFECYVYMSCGVPGATLCDIDPKDCPNVRPGGCEEIRTAELLHKEQIKPESLGESSEEQGQVLSREFRDQMNSAARAFVSAQSMLLQPNEEFLVKHSFISGYSKCYTNHGPTSEPPEEQEELKLLASKICEEVISIERQSEMSFDDMWERRDKQIKKVIELLTPQKDWDDLLFEHLDNNSPGE